MSHIDTKTLPDLVQQTTELRNRPKPNIPSTDEISKEVLLQVDGKLQNALRDINYEHKLNLLNLKETMLNERTSNHCRGNNERPRDTTTESVLNRLARMRGVSFNIRSDGGEGRGNQPASSSDEDRPRKKRKSSRKGKK